MNINQKILSLYQAFLAFSAIVVTTQVFAEHQVFFFPSTAEAETRQGFVRVINHSDLSGEVSITAVDDAGVEKGPIALSLSANSAKHFNSTDLEEGNAGKGLSGGVGTGQGAWRLSMESDLDIEVLSYIRTRDGFVTTMHETLPSSSNNSLHRYAVIFNPASNYNQVSSLRLINNTHRNAQVSITGVDDQGISGNVVKLSIPANAVRMFTSQELESGTGEGITSGALGDGTGKWQLFIESDQPLVALSVLESPTGHIANLSTLPKTHSNKHIVPLFPASADSKGRQGFLRVTNHSSQDATVSISAFNNTDWEYEPVTLSLEAHKTQHFNSDDLELGNEDKGLTGSTGIGEGDWYLELSSDQDISVMAYLRTPGGFLTSAHDLIMGQEDGTYHRVAIFNPGSNYNQVSVLRVINLGEEDADIVVSGIDDSGSSPGTDVSFMVPAGKFRAITAQELETGVREFSEMETGFEDESIEGALADGTGKWQLIVQSSVPVFVMSILETPTGHLTNLSTTP
ncbi:MAG: hypothetical protein OXK80_05490 [Bdellovibrionales bacterium]|nr:hypothetical protein [Bdellovibrionales bacterium]